MAPDAAQANTGTFTVDEAHAGMRLDRYLAAVALAVTRSRAQRLIASGGVMVNGKPAKASYATVAGDQVSLAGDALAAPAESLPAPEAIPLHIVYEDDFLIVIDKPAGMVVHPAPGHAGGTLVNALLAHTARLGNAATTRPGIVHRLDKDTSGLMLVAKDDATLAALGAAMRRHAVTKQYLALVEGRLDPPAGAIEAPIGRDPRWRQRMAVVALGGRAARTLYATERVIGGRSLLRLTLVTGRTHQIRVHCAAVGHPVVGDPLYGRVQPPQPPRIFLHAAHLALAHPVTGVPLTFTSPLPDDLAAFLARLAGE
jgi:23S rRNA pseudouridine1911/1915/1917 synthase